MLTTLLLLSSLSSWSQSNPSTGNETQSDTATVVIPIDFLRKANAKMIERDYLLKINAEQDLIISLKDKQIDNLSINIKKEKKKKKYTIIAFIIGVLTGIVIK